MSTKGNLATGDYTKGEECAQLDKHLGQKCIPVGCVLPACCPYLPGPGRGGVPGPGGCTWSRGVHLVLGGVYLFPGTWSQGCTWSRGVPCPGGYTWSGGGGTWSGGCTWSCGGCTWSRRECLVLGGGCTCPGTHHTVNRMTDRYKNITLTQTSFVGGKN